MTHDEFRIWALRQLGDHMRRNMPAAKMARQLKADSRGFKKSLDHARRSQSASQAASKRKLDRRLSALEGASRERRAALDRELEERRWGLIMGSK